MALIYEYMLGGTLSDYLYDVAKLEMPLDWHKRLNIARQAADAASLNEKSDVYSFGVVLLEIIFGVAPKKGIVESAHNLLSCGKLSELMDSSLGGRYDVESTWKVAEIAYMCLEKESTNRPKMSVVVKELEEVVTLASGDNNYSASHSVCGELMLLEHAAHALLFLGSTR
ncbi:hypothetical protein SUGI_0372380 [Cryptomeria japonica]|nr:hypothetical protein SUGI_0372380 [Cryptomeria japonica]